MYVYVLFFMLKLRFASYLINEYVMLCYVIINLKHWPGLAGFYENEPVNEVRFYSYNHQACMNRARYGRHYLLFIACAITLHYITTLLAVQFCSVP